MSTNGRNTGRIMVRRPYVCESCGVRRAIGAPRASDTWPQRLHLTRQQMNELLIAAAEFTELSQESGEDADAIAFLDWVAPDALREMGASTVVVDDPGYWQRRRSA